MSGKLRYFRVVAVLGAPWVLCGQEKPLNVSGTFSTGYYNTYTRGEVNQSLGFVPFGAAFDITGYYLSPDLLSYTVQPELNIGPQASEAGFQGGNGIRLSVTFLRKRIMPVTFHYANLQVQDVYFGGLSQVSGYSLKNRNKDLGVTWEFKPKGLPATTVDVGTSSVDSKSSAFGIPDYLSHGNHVNADTQYETHGWDFDGFLHHQRQVSDLLERTVDGSTMGELLQTVTQYQGSARRSFLRDSDLYLSTGSQSTSSILFTMPIDMTTRYVTANLRLSQRRRWRTSLRGNYSSNIASQLLEQAAGSLFAPGSITASGNILAPFSRTMTHYNVNSLTNVMLGHGFEFFGSVERSAILSSSDGGPLDASFISTSAGMTYNKRFHWGSFGGEYSREFGIGSVTGQSGTLRGQNYSVTAQHASSGGLTFDGSIRGTDQSVHNAQPASQKSFSTEGSVAGRVGGSLSARVGGGWQWGDFVNTANQFHTSGFTARAGIEHPRFQLNGSISNTNSNSLPLYGDLLTGLGVGTVLLPGLRVIPSYYRAMNFSFHATPLRKVELSATWTHSLQHLEGILSNDFGLLNASATYHFRRIQFEAGFIHSNQIFQYYQGTMRQRFYVKISRTARLL